MTTAINRTRTHTILFLIASSGFAGVAWEVIWQLKTTLALGISALGTALTLAIMMGGMGLGAILMGNLLRQYSSIKSLHWYSALEITAGLAGLLLTPAFLILEKLDSRFYASHPEMSMGLFILGLIAILGIPTLCMGATIPIFSRIANNLQIPISKLYGLNTFGAAASAMLAAFIFIPVFGVTHTVWLVAAINIVVGVCAWLLAKHEQIQPETTSQPAPQQTKFPLHYLIIVFVTGFATFTLEIAWFRSLYSVLANTTDIFAIILVCVLLALGLAARDVKKTQHDGLYLAKQLCIAGLLILLVTPIIERLDNIYIYHKHYMTLVQQNQVALAASTNGSALNNFINGNNFQTNSVAMLFYALQTFLRLLMIAIVIVPTLRVLGRALPWILDHTHHARHAGMLYAINTFAAICGSLIAAWLLLPMFGFAKTAWIAGILVMIPGIIMLTGNIRFLYTAAGISALFIAYHFETGIGKSYVQGFLASDRQGVRATVLKSYNGPDATVSAIEYRDGTRTLMINSVGAAWESGTSNLASIHYMPMMGQLPMLLHSNPQQALVICFGTGQTANAVRNAQPHSLDIVDVNANVFKLGHFFLSNQQVLSDARIKPIVMDGRAYLRRSKKKYDVITLEPMPPSAAGVNSLYSREFYQLARSRLSAHGVIAQWMPLHLVAPHYTASIARTFIDVFPNAVLWIDPESKAGILLGTKDNSTPLAATWPGFQRLKTSTSLQHEIESNIALHTDQLRQYASYGEIITDDNQLLAYGKALYASMMLKENYSLLQRINNKIEMPQIDSDYK